MSPTPGNRPSGPRVVLGRETTPTPQQKIAPSRIPKEVWDRFEGKSREVSPDLFNERFRETFFECSDYGDEILKYLRTLSRRLSNSRTV